MDRDSKRVIVGLTKASPLDTYSYPHPCLTLTCRPAAATLYIMTNVSGWLPVPGKQMSYNKKAVRACMPTQLEQERGAGGGALLFPISALSWLLARA